MRQRRSGELCGTNTYLDSFVQYRRNQGLPASVLDLGVLGEIGYLVRDQKLLNMMSANSVRLSEEKELLNALQFAICTSKTKQTPGELTSPVLAVGLGSTKPHSRANVTPPWPRDARFGAYYIHESREQIERHGVDDDGLREFLAEIENNCYILNEPESEVRITTELGKLIAPHAANGKEMSDEEVANIAIDSLMSIEIRNWLRRKLAVEVTTAEISKAGTVRGLGKLTMEKLRAKYIPEQMENKVRG